VRFPRRLRFGDSVTLVEHLEELRGRLVVSLAAIALAFGFSYGFRHQVLDALNRPLDGKIPTTFSPVEPFMTSFTVSLYAALAVALPIVVYQVWCFVAPAFEERDQKLVSRLVLFATFLFIGGIMFSYFVVLPAATPFLLGFDAEQYDIQIRARDYYSFVAMTSLAVGLLFELPIVILGLVRLGILSAAKLRRNRRIGIVVCFVIAVALPGIDPVTTTLQAVPLLLLFEASIWLSSFFEKRWAAQAAAREAAELETDGLTASGQP
jgi:sec-independent protein translocase protein TatC